MSSEVCIHGCQPIRNICYFSDCRLPAFVCMSCEDCLTAHQHEGNTTLRKLNTLSGQVEALAAKNASSSQSDQIRNAAGQVIGRLNGISRQVQTDFIEIGKRLEIKPNIAQLVDRIRSHDMSLTGSEVNILTQAIRNKEVYVNKQVVEEKTSQLEEVYEDFLSQLSQLVKEFTQTRQSILNGEYAPKSKAEQQRLNQSASLRDGARQNQSVSQKNSTNELPSTKSGVKYARVSDPVPIREPSPEEQLEFIKIADIRPEMEHFNIIAKVMTVFSQKYVDKTFIKCVLADDTASVKASFPFVEGIKKGEVLEFCDMKTHVQNKHIILNTIRDGCIYTTDRKLLQVNDKVNISDKSW